MKNSYRLAAMSLFGMAAATAFADSTPDEWYRAIREDDTQAVRALLRTANVNERDDRGTTPLAYAAAVGSPSMVGLLISAGADVNAQNAFGVSPLMLAIGEPAKVSLLVSHGADVNAKSKVGRTPLLLACMVSGNSATVHLLIEKGAVVAVRDDAMKITPLLAATAANDGQTIDLLLKHGAPVNDQNIGGITPLMNASGYGNLAVMRRLLLQGANVNAVSGPQIAPPVKNGPLALGLLTPLMMAATTGGAEAVQLLLGSGAKPDARDVRGMTALMLSVASDHADPKAAAKLLAAGADPNLKDLSGESAIDWAQKYNQPEVLKPFRLEPRLANHATRLDLTAYAGPSVKDAVGQSAQLLQKSTQSFLKEGGCVACHAQEIAVTAVKAAHDRGVAVDESIRQDQRQAAEKQFASGEYMLMQRMDPPVVDILTYALSDLATENAPASRTTDAVLHNLVAQQNENGSWRSPGISRAPMSDGDFSRTAMAIRAIEKYGSNGRHDDLEARVQRAAGWLAKAHPVTTEDRVMQLTGLYWARSPQFGHKERIHDLLALQNSDGGWAQTAWLGSDAYATGQVLCALHDLGVPNAEAAIRRGVDYLLRTRQSDGSWLLKSRATHIQPYFESGFPHAGDQWISSTGTALATAALAYSLPAEAVRLSAQK